MLRTQHQPFSTDDSAVLIFYFHISLCIVTVRADAFTAPTCLNACCIRFHLCLTSSQREFTTTVSGCESSCFTTHSLFIRPHHQMKQRNDLRQDAYSQTSHQLVDFPGHWHIMCYYVSTYAVRTQWWHWESHHSLFNMLNTCCFSCNDDWVYSYFYTNIQESKSKPCERKTAWLLLVCYCGSVGKGRRLVCCSLWPFHC